MRILQVNSASGFGGGEKHLLDLSFCLKTRGHEIFVALRPGAVWREKLEFISNQNIMRLPMSNAFDLQSAWQLATFIKQNNIEIVHAHLARDYPLAAFAVRMSKTKARLVLTRHVLFPINSLHRWILPKQTMFIAVSKAVQEILKQVVSPNYTRLIYNGVDTRHFSNIKRSFDRAAFFENLKLAPNRRYVGIIGEITAHKGQADFVRAAAIISERYADVDFLIVGDDNSRGEIYRPALEKQIAELNIKNRIHFLGWLADVAPALYGLEIFVSASRVEPFGLAIVEAMATGLPIVSTKSEGASEILINDETGKIVSIGNAQAIAKGVIEFLNDSQMRKDFGSKAQRVAKEKFDLARMTSETEKIYQETLGYP